MIYNNSCHLLSSYYASSTVVNLLNPYYCFAGVKTTYSHFMVYSCFTIEKTETLVVKITDNWLNIMVIN